MKEQIARIIARECSGAESIWKSKMRVVDLILDEIDKSFDEIEAQMRVGISDSDINPTWARKYAKATFHALIAMAKDGK